MKIHTRFWGLTPSFYFCSLWSTLPCLAFKASSTLTAPSDLHIPNVPGNPRSQMLYGPEQKTPQQTFLSSLGLLPSGLQCSTALSGSRPSPPGK